MSKPKYQKGVAILFAVLLVSVVLTVSLTLLNITLRELILSSLARESQFSFYAADSARSCARYYDGLDDATTRPFGSFGLSGTNLTYNPPGSLGAPVALVCGQGVVLPNPPTMTSRGTYWDTSFIVTFVDPNGKQTCAKVFVTKGVDNSGTPASPEYAIGKTKIEAFGYNNYNGGGQSYCYSISDRTVERASRMIY